MRIALASISFIACFGVACGKKAPAPMLAVAPTPKPPAIQLLPAAYLEEFAPELETRNTIMQWEAILIEFKVADTERHGLTKFFEKVGEKNSIIEKQNATSPLAQLARAHTNVVLQTASGAYAARATLDESKEFLQYLQGSSGVDTLSQPSVITKGTNEAMLQTGNTLTVVLGGPKRSDPATILTTNVTLGTTVSLQLHARNDRGIVIEAAARIDGFHGYESTENETPRPVFSVSTMGTRTQLATNEVLILGGPIQMNVVKTVDRVAYLSDIPALGRLFTETHVYTNFVRTLVIVRPTLKN
jgi:type II secretory pathway component GspD/PulD (secretin)